MYIPKYAEHSEKSLIVEFITTHPFATLITADSELSANHFPLLFEDRKGNCGALIGHMARGNPQWKQLEQGKPILAIFQGPHSYISPSIYVNKLNVPTWNYSAIHAYGRAKVTHSQDRIEEILEKTVLHFETQREKPWKYDLPQDFRESLVKAIVGFEIEIERFDSKFKLSQNRSAEDYAAVVEDFKRNDDQNSRELLKYMALTKPIGRHQ